MTREESNAMMDAEAQRLGTGSSAFMERHREIMELADQIQQQYEKRPCQSTSMRRLYEKDLVSTLSGLRYYLDIDMTESVQEQKKYGELEEFLNK